MAYRITPHTNITNDDGTINITEDGGNDVVSVNLGKDNKWTATQTIETEGTTVPLVVQAAENQTADLQQWKDASGNVVSRVNSAGELEIAVQSGVISITNDDGTLTIAPTTGDAVAKLNLGRANTWSATQTIAPSTDTVALVVKGQLNQTQDLQQWQDAAGNTVMSVNGDGQLVLPTTLTAPGVAPQGMVDGACIVDPPARKMWVVMNGDWRETSFFGEPSLCQGRLTVVSGVPVPAADVVGANTIYFTPFEGNRLSIYDGTSWHSYQFNEVSLNLVGLTPHLPYDVFAYYKNTVVLSLNAWTDGNTRAGNLLLQDGIYVMGTDPTHRFLGTIYTTSANTTEDSGVRRFVSNYRNRRMRRLQIMDQATHTYNVATWRAYNNSLANRVEFVIAIEEDAISGTLFAQTNSNGYVGVNVDATDGSGIMVKCVGTAANADVWAGSAPNYFPANPGYHFFQAIEWAGGGPASNFTGMVLGGIVNA